jgi:hypothetical protein
MTTPGHIEEIDQDLLQRIRSWAALRRTIELTLYGSVTIVAVILGVRVDDAISTPRGLIAAMWATSISLVVAHGFAVSISNRVVSPTPLPLGHYFGSLVEGAPLLISSVVGTIGAVIAGLFSPTVQSAARGADIALVAFCSIIAFAGATYHQVPIRRRLILATFVALFLTFIALIKVILDH